jgi:hypothetical protein
VKLEEKNFSKRCSCSLHAHFNLVVIAVKARAAESICNRFLAEHCLFFTIFSSKIWLIVFYFELGRREIKIATEGSTNITVFLDSGPCNLVEIYRHLGGPYGLHVRHNIAEGCRLQKEVRLKRNWQCLIVIYICIPSPNSDHWGGGGKIYGFRFWLFWFGGC